VTAYEVILKKRDGGELSSSEIAFMVRGFLAGEVADYQMSAFLMAVFFTGMTDQETEILTRVMLGSGIVLDLSDVDGVKVDKHSTGGVGDKLSLIVAPIAASLGVRVPMISGRGLGHTGGTLDKLESIPGMRTDFSPAEFKRLVATVGMAIVGQSPSIAPADRTMYALRDVTATIECAPLIVGSILSKKLAAGLDALVLDVKVGRGAFMRDLGSARTLAERLVATAARFPLPATAVLTDMESPLGRAVGNALEVAESVEVLSGAGPGDVREVSIALAAEMIVLAGLAKDREEASRLAARSLDDGSALQRFASFVEAQGGDPAIVERPSILPSAPVTERVRADRAGHVVAIDALEVGLTSTSLGVGRKALGERIDPAAGIEIVASIGDEVRPGDVLALVHARREDAALAGAARIKGAFLIGPEAPRLVSKVLWVRGGKAR
jgi:pyrimidine-nucleoside phosphorylase